MSGTRVTVTDIETGESKTVEITDDYGLICDGTCYQHSIVMYANGTRQITIKGGRP